MSASELQPTACNLCYANCGILVEVNDGHIVKVRGDKDHPASRGYLCNKASRLDYYQQGLDRLAVVEPVERGLGIVARIGCGRVLNTVRIGLVAASWAVRRSPWYHPGSPARPGSTFGREWNCDGESVRIDR